MCFLGREQFYLMRAKQRKKMQLERLKTNKKEKKKTYKQI